MTLIQLEYFHALARNQHLLKTAEELHVSPPTLSTSLRNLETELGTPLFDRVGRNIILNEQGKIFLSYVDNVFQDIENGKTAVSHSVAKQQSIIRISISDSPFVICESPIIMNLVAKYNIQILDQDTDDAGNLINDQKLDFMITAKDLRKNSNLDYVQLYESSYVLAVSEDSLLASKKFCTFDALQDETFICRPSSDYFEQCVESVFKSHNFIPARRISADYVTRPRLIKNNAGISITTNLALNNSFYKELIPVHIQEFEGYYYNYYIYWRKDKPLSFDLKYIIDQMLEVGKQKMQDASRNQIFS